MEAFIRHGASKVYLAVRNPGFTSEMSRTYGDKVVTLPVHVADAASSEGIVAALEQGAFHLFPDATAKEVWSAYQSYATAVVESQDQEAA